MKPSWSRAHVENELVINKIISTISQAEGVESAKLTPPLHDAIDTDALEQLVTSADEPLSVTFPYRQWIVEVRSGDEVEVTILSDEG